MMAAKLREVGKRNRSARLYMQDKMVSAKRVVSHGAIGAPAMLMAAL